MIEKISIRNFRGLENIEMHLAPGLSEKDYLSNTSSPRSSHHKQRRILLQGIAGVNDNIRLIMALVDSGVFCANSLNYLLPPESYSSVEYLLGLLNSSLINWIFAKLSTNSNVNGYEVYNLPIRKGKSEEKIAALAAKITAAKQAGPNADTAALEREIDRLVYGLYGLTEDEVKIIEGSA